MMVTPPALPLLYIPHGGGPCFFMKESFGPPGTWDKMEQHLRGLSKTIGQTPKAILVISAHWEENRPTVQTGSAPSMLFDYYGFPDYTYRLNYPAPGSPELAATIKSLLASQGIECAEDGTRGFDHGLFIPFMLIYPDARIPIIELSLRHDLDPEFHIQMGKALAPLAEQGVLMVGSGMSYHNLSTFMAPSSAKHQEEAFAFDEWLIRAVTDPNTQHRNSQLGKWELAPGARAAHPREEHLIPLMVIAGAASTKVGKIIYSDIVMAKPISSFLFI
jgi:aromatic ring-opening dioxygenase catalytic subunit (LigB family)